MGDLQIAVRLYPWGSRSADFLPLYGQVFNAVEE
jgi:hypothetical protein